jgi:hypothetical protein
MEENSLVNFEFLIYFVMLIKMVTYVQFLSSGFRGQLLNLFVCTFCRSMCTGLTSTHVLSND